MFDFFKKKSIIWIGSFLLIIMAATFLLVYQTYAALIKNDFLKKQSFFIQQTAQMLKDYLLSLEEQTILLINKNQISANILQRNYSSLNNIHFDNIDFSQVEIFTVDENRGSFRTYLASSPLQVLTLSDIERFLNGENSVWYCLDSVTNANTSTHLIHIKRIKSDAETIGYLVAQINANSLNRILSLNTNAYHTSKPNLFAEYSAASIQIEDRFFQWGDKQINIRRANELGGNQGKIYVKSYLFKCDLGVRKMSLIVEGDLTCFKDNLAFIKQVLLLTYLVITLIIITFLRLFTCKIDFMINKLYRKMTLNHPDHAFKEII